MSKVANLLTDLDKLDGSNYKSWSGHMQRTLIYIELWKDVCSGESAPTKPTDVRDLARWELKDEKALSLLRSFVSDEMFVHIENVIDAWIAWKIFKNMFDTQPESKRVDLHSKLLKQRLVEGGDVLAYISHLKNIRLEIVKCEFKDVEEIFLTSILINGLPPSYKHFLETLQITDKLESQNFDSLSDLLV